MPAKALRRLILRCTLCAPDGVLIEPTSANALYAAADHALDEHLDQLVADPDRALSGMCVVA